MFKSLRDTISRRRQVRRTHAELSSLTDRELNDIGITRGEIRRVAMGI